MDVPLKPLSVSRERYERIYRLIRDRICLLEYKPGARLAEEDLAREFGVSRTPIRRVLSRLENEGLLTSRHGVGTFVTDIDLGSLIQVYRLRMELAEMMGRLDPLPRTSADLDQVRALIARSDLLVKEPDGRAYARLNMDFFQELSSMIGNQPLQEITCRLYYQTTRIWLDHGAASQPQGGDRDLSSRDDGHSGGHGARRLRSGRPYKAQPHLDERQADDAVLASRDLLRCHLTR